MRRRAFLAGIAAAPVAAGADLGRGYPSHADTFDRRDAGDAELLQLFAKWHRLELLANDRSLSDDAADLCTSRQRSIEDRIMALQARTMAGVQAKAMVGWMNSHGLASIHAPIARGESTAAEVALQSLCRDLERLVGEVRS